VDKEGAIARSYADAPEIDGVVYIEPDASIKPGDWVDVCVTDTNIHDMWAKKI
ncbi:MAG: 30S ribosomal protein S12 methylthiotransferase RimO, partial [Nitrosomonas sp.]|nr:30S ribosomal protein S12 methylthiotransferase RimO [Nitrosomonas sp.]